MATIRKQPGAIAWGVAALLAFLPFLLVTIPPLADAPGHLGRMAVQAAGPDSPLRRDFAFHWALRLNLGTDLAVEGLRHMFGLVRAFWLVAALLPVLTVLAIRAVTRAANAGGGAAASWALPFAYCYPLSYGFLNYVLGMALSLFGFALWLQLAERRRLREALFWPLLPALLIVHSIGGALLPLMIGAAVLGERLPAAPGMDTLIRQRARTAARELRPLLGLVPLALVTRGGASAAGGGDFNYDLLNKANVLAQALRDQWKPLDLLSVGGVLAVLTAGRLLGARYRAGHGAVVLALLALFLLAPNQIGGASFVDTRLIAPLAIAALTLQDWSRVDRRAARVVTVAGFALFAARMAFTTAGFAAYARSYAAETQALAHVPRGARVLALVSRACGASRNWRASRLDHVPALATLTREAWVNAHWDIAGQQLLQVRFRPAAAFYDDPSHYVWPQACVDAQRPPRTPAEERTRRRTIAGVLPMLPLAKVDYLWLIQVRLPPGPWTTRLVPVWHEGGSSLYAVRR